VAAIKRVRSNERAFFTVDSSSLGSDGGDCVAGHLVDTGDILGWNSITLAISDQRRNGGEELADTVHEVIFG
jgi:hypothetical protein